jgi:uncharacterized tellurite resistance protein B-like protein
MQIFGFFKNNSEKELAKSHIKNLIAMAQADGYFDQIEYEFLLQIARKHKLSEKNIEEVKNQPEKVSLNVPDNHEVKFHQLYDLVNMMMIDGVVHNNEVRLCRNLAEQLGYHPDKVSDLVDSVMQHIQVGNSPTETLQRLQRTLGVN